MMIVVARKGNLAEPASKKMVAILDVFTVGVSDPHEDTARQSRVHAVHKFRTFDERQAKLGKAVGLDTNP